MPPVRRVCMDVFVVDVSRNLETLLDTRAIHFEGLETRITA